MFPAAMVKETLARPALLNAGMLLSTSSFALARQPG
jgi:hypothetical protein